MQVEIDTLIGLKVELLMQGLVQIIALRDHFLHLTELLNVLLHLICPRRWFMHHTLQIDQILALGLPPSTASMRVRIRLQ